MEVVRITPRGYCHGVVEAIRMARQAGRERIDDEPVTMLGYLVHNEHVTRDLEAEGVRLIEAPDRMAGLDQITGGTVVFTAHGIDPAVVDEARRRGLRVVDATCTDVIRTHDLVRQLVSESRHVIYIGKRGHPEPAGVMGVAPEHTTLVESIEEVDALVAPSRPLAVTCQTTLSVWDTQRMIDRLVERFPTIEVHNEICRATQDRQEAAVRAATDVDAVVVVGSSRSSNSQRLVQVVRERAGRQALLVDTAADLDPAWFQGMHRIGVTAGASTPTQLTREVIAAIEAIEVTDPVS